MDFGDLRTPEECSVAVARTGPFRWRDPEPNASSGLTRLGPYTEPPNSADNWYGTQSVL